MNDVLKFGKKLFTFSVVAVTIAWSVGVSALIPAGGVMAEECPVLEAGDLYKVPNSSSVYYLNAEMESMYFPTEEVFNSWGFSFDDVITIPNTCFDLYEQATPAGLNFRPGSRLVKRVESPTVYAVLPGNARAAIGSEEVAMSLYGENWASLVRDLPGVFMSNFLSTASEIDEAVPHNGQFVQETGSDTVYFVMDGELYMVDGEVTEDVREVSSAVFAELADSGETVTLASTMENPGQLGESTGDGDTTTVVGGDLTVSLSANTPEAATVPINVDNVEFTKVIFRALDEDVIVNSVKIGRRGLGETGDFTSVTLYDEDGEKLGNTKTSWTSDGYMNYNISGGWTIPAGTAKTLTITAKLGVAGKYNALGVEDVTTNGSDVSGLSVYGNQMNGVSVTVGAVTLTGDYAGSATAKIGETDVKLTKFNLSLSSKEDAEFESITLKNIGSASDGDIANMYLTVGGTTIATDATMESDYITFVLDEPYLIEKSKNETFTVYGDIVNGDAHTVKFIVKNTTDLKMTGKSYNTNLSVTNAAFNNTTSTQARTITIDGAELNISFTSAAYDTMDDQTDVEFGTLTLNAGSANINITELVMTVTETNGDGDVSNNKDIDELEIVDEATGAAYAGSETTVSDTTAAVEEWTFDDEIYLEAGKTYTFTVRGDLPTGIGNGDAYNLAMSISTTTLKAETDPEGDTVDNFSIASFTGKKVTVKTPSLKVRSTNLANIDVVEDQENVVLFEGTMEAIAGDVRVERMKFEEAVSSYFQEDNWSEVGLYVAGEMQQYISGSSLVDAELDFDTLDFTIGDNDGLVDFKVMGKISSTKDTTTTTTKIQLDTVTVKDEDNDSISATNSSGTTIANGAELTTARTITVKGTGILYVQMRNNDTGFSKDRILLAGTDDVVVGRLRVKADYEDITIEDLVLTNVTSTANDSVSSVCLYNEDDEELACTTLDGATATFSDLDEVVEEGTHDWTIKVSTVNIGEAYTGDSHDSISFKIASTSTHLVARGVDSGDALTHNTSTSAVAEGEIAFDQNVDGDWTDSGDIETAYTKTFYLAASKISTVSTVNSYDGQSVGDEITGTGEYNAMILSVTTEENSNTDSSGNDVKTLLTGLIFDFDKNASTTISSATIERIGGAGDPAQTLVVTGGTNTTGTLAISSIGSTLEDYKIEAGDVAYYLVKVNVSALSSTAYDTNWFQIDMDDLKGSYNTDANNNIDWKDGYSDTAFNALFLDVESIDGTKISRYNG